MRVLLAGATGLVGQVLLRLLEDDASVTALDVVGRRRAESRSGKVEQHVAPMPDWPALVTQLKPEVAISALGTTLKTAGSEEAFAAVDLDAVLSFAGASLAAGARQFLLVSSIGAHPSSRNFYLSIKGKAEAGLQTMGYERVDIFRPGLLRGVRGGPTRIGERAAIAVSPITDLLTPRVLDHYRSIAAENVAGAIRSLIGAQPKGVYFHDNRAMLRPASDK